ncbi:Predicted metal-dependent peptidase [Thermoanaerobacter thermohydrosulfuricus]|uniref:Predicted metal-dependent peptidase n=1 Tax=Thermoanaerobacter thermohydrosulfuricus TaxID=1516 RepID=A0A1G7LSD5_THETY|nr:VWA-like domain-containing protein [Thermoanaerobacter thermohydrosulfuricus]SDF52311.1 Predicted metal-dependent peptidase [Thermoanaerobacter thermohydrosulfuricus]
MLPEKIQAARFRLMNERPYIAAALLSLQTVEDINLDTMAVDKKWRLYYDPAVAEKWSVDELVAVLYHEVLHMLRDHLGRLVNYPVRIANIAADAEINDDILKEGFKLPGNPVTPESIQMDPGLLAEEYAEELMKRTQEEIQAILQMFDIKGIGIDSSEQSGQGSKPKPGGGICGSIATGQSEPWELDGTNENNKEAPGLSQTELEILRKTVAEEIKNYERTHGRGSVPGYLSRWAEEKLKPKIDWRKELTATIRNTVANIAGMVDYSYSKPSRRQSVVNNIILPSMRQPLVSAAVVIDTSGSMSDEMLSQAVVEVNGVLYALGFRDRIWYIACDADVHVTKKISSIKQIKLEGGGGTDMGKGIEAASSLNPKPDVCIVLTDGYTPWPKDAPQKMKVIVGLIIEKGDSVPKVPDWAKKVEIRM